jgi:hypothetical protein
VYQTIGKFPQLLIPNHRLWIHFMSHKLGRLLLPYAFISLLISSFFLPDPLKYFAWAAQAGFYSLAVLDIVLPDTSPLKRLSSLFGTFVAMMAAAVLSTGAALFVSPHKLWKPTR